MSHVPVPCLTIIPVLKSGGRELQQSVIYNLSHREEKYMFLSTTDDYRPGYGDYPCVRSLSRKSRDLDALGSKEVMVMKVGILVTVEVVSE